MGTEANNPAAGGQQTAATPASAATETVPLHVVEALRNELKSVKSQNQSLSQTVQTQSNMLSSAQGQSASHDDVDEDAIITVREARELVRAAVAPLVGVTTEVQMARKYPDYESTITIGLPAALEAEPSLREAIASSKNPHLLAYTISKQYLPPKAATPPVTTTDPEQVTKKLESNAQKPGSASQAGSSGGGLRDVNKYAAMNDADFLAEIERVKRK